MQSNSSRPSKGKGRSRDADYAQSFASLSLSDCVDPLVPRSGYYDPSSYTDAYSASYENPYTVDGQYALTGQSSRAPAQSSSASSSATYGSAGAYSSSYPNTSATSSTGAYEYQNDHSGTSSYSGHTGYDTGHAGYDTGHAGYDTASVTSSSAPSYSASGWSDSQSRGTAVSSVPSRQSHRTDVNNTIHQQAPPSQRYQLPCEFHNLTGCTRVFPGDDIQGWIDHVEEHLRSKFPSKLRCWFCTDHYFDARETSSGDTRSNFITRMNHIRDHFVYDGSRPEQMLMDGHLVQHLLDQNLIDRRTYDSIVNPEGPLPPIPGGQGQHRSHRSHRSYLPQVDEEVAAESSGSRHHHHRSDHHRSDHHSSDRHRSGHHRSSHRRDSDREHGSSSSRHRPRNS